MPRKKKQDTAPQDKSENNTLGVEQAKEFSTFGERDDLLAKYEESQKKSTEPAPEEAEPETSPEEEVAAEEEKQPEAEKQAEEEESTSVDDYQQEEQKQEDTKTVPYGALKEEREKRKSSDAQVGELQKQLHEVLQDVKKLHEENSKLKAASDEFDDDTDTGWSEDSLAKKQAQKISDLEAKLKAIEDKEKSAEQKTAQEKAVQKALTIDKELASKGYPGFYFCTGEVMRIIAKQIEAGKPYHEADTEENFKDTFIKEVFPKIRDQFSNHIKAQTVAEKEALKKKANLSDKAASGKDESAAQSSDDWSYADYKKLRRSNAQGFAP